MLHPAALLTTEESRAADRVAMQNGISGETLMENSGRAVADLATQNYSKRPVLVVCGLGNNGGDGFVAARFLKERGWPVTLAVAGDADDIRGDAKLAKNKWNMTGSPSRTFNPGLLKDAALVIDAIFGTGLSRVVEDAPKDAIKAINDSKLPVIAVDIASGVNADTGAVMGIAVRATHTVTFVRPKPGHLLLPGKAHAGELHTYDIGVSGDGIKPRYFLNAPVLWRSLFPFPVPDSHKYTRGHAIIVGGGPGTSGAARLAAMGALRAGAGLVSVACTLESLPIYAATLTAVMTKTVSQLNQLSTLLEDKRVTASLIGPGCGVTEATREQTLHILSQKKSCVIDADAISIFHSNPKPLFAAINGPVVMTPHEGEFERIFKMKGAKPERAREAAKQSNAVILLKGNDTVIAAPDGRVAINANAPSWLATAGSGDVLAGMITGLLAQGMPAFEAACAAAWLHGEAAAHFGPGLISEDLPQAIPAALKVLFSEAA